MYLSCATFFAPDNGFFQPDFLISALDIFGLSATVSARQQHFRIRQPLGRLSIAQQGARYRPSFWSSLTAFQRSLRLHVPLRNPALYN